MKSKTSDRLGNLQNMRHAIIIMHAGGTPAGVKPGLLSQR